MKISPENKSKIADQVKSLEDKKDFLKLLNFTKKLMYGKECKPLLLKSVTWYANPKLSEGKRYRTFLIPKKSGESREIHAPVAGLKSILRILNVIFDISAGTHKCATGFVSGKSIVDNADLHIGKHYIYNTDLKDFFYSFDRNRVKMGLWKALFGMRKEQEPLAFLIASLCTHPIYINGKTRTVLPQGSPTSPVITNILCNKLDRRLNGLAKRFNIKYSRYADDITFSANYNIFIKDEFQSELNRIVMEDQNLKFNSKKTRLQNSGYRQEVTGLKVNEKVNVRRSYIKEIRMWLYYCEKYGYKKANEIFQKDQDLSYKIRNLSKPQLANVLDGKLEFLKMVKGADDSVYVKLRKKYIKSNPQENEVDEIIKIWEEDSLDTAIVYSLLSEATKKWY